MEESDFYFYEDPYASTQYLKPAQAPVPPAARGWRQWLDAELEAPLWQVLGPVCFQAWLAQVPPNSQSGGFCLQALASEAGRPFR
jgi:hypothetical protein